MSIAQLTARLRIPVIAAPMTGVSGPDLVVAACRHGIIGSFPTHNARTVEELDGWLTHISGSLTPAAAPVAANLVVHRSNQRLRDDIECLRHHRVGLVITSVGSPASVIEPLHDSQIPVLADVATMRHVDRAIEAGADGLVLLTAGAGGQTGWNNPFAFVRAVRERFAGPLVLAGGGSDGTALLAAQVLGVDLVYMGTKFIATHESLAAHAYRAALVNATMDDVVQTSAPSGLPANFLAESLGDGGDGVPANPATLAGQRFDLDRLSTLSGPWAAGHTVHAVSRIRSVADLVKQTRTEYLRAVRRTRQHLDHVNIAISRSTVMPVGKEVG